MHDVERRRAQMENLEREREEAEEEDPATAEDAATVETEPLLLELHAAKRVRADIPRG